MFGGGTNEYREDLGVMTFGINDQRRPWEQLPGRFGNNEPGNQAPNRDYKNVALETLRSSSNNNPSTNTRLDQDISKSQPFSVNSFGKPDKEFPEVITPAPKSRETTTLVGGRSLTSVDNFLHSSIV